MYKVNIILLFSLYYICAPNTNFQQSASVYSNVQFFTQDNSVNEKISSDRLQIYKDLLATQMIMIDEISNLNTLSDTQNRLRFYKETDSLCDCLTEQISKLRQLDRCKFNQTSILFTKTKTFLQKYVDKNSSITLQVLHIATALCIISTFALWLWYTIFPDFYTYDSKSAEMSITHTLALISSTLSSSSSLTNQLSNTLTSSLTLTNTRKYTISGSLNTSNTKLPTHTYDSYTESSTDTLNKTTTITRTIFIEYVCYKVFEYTSSLPGVVENGISYQCYLDNRNDIASANDICDRNLDNNNAERSCLNGSKICYDAVKHCYNMYSYADTTCQIRLNNIGYCDNLRVLDIKNVSPTRAIHVGNYIDRLVSLRPYICFLYNMVIMRFGTTFQEIPQRYCYKFKDVKPVSVISEIAIFIEETDYHQKYQLNDLIIYCYHKAAYPLCGYSAKVAYPNIVGDVIMSYNTYSDSTWRVGIDGGVIQKTQMPSRLIVDSITDLYEEFGVNPCVANINC